MEKFSVCRSERFYYAWPTMVKLKDDSLFCIFTSCNHHIDRDNSQLMSVRSFDRGRTWTEPEPFTELTHSDCFYNNARVQRMGDDIVVVCDKVRKNENGPSPAQVYMWISHDEARTFSPAIPTAGCGIVPDIRQLSSGSWILTAHRKVPELDKLVQFGWISTDRGASWSEEIPIGRIPGITCVKPPCWNAATALWWPLCGRTAFRATTASRRFPKTEGTPGSPSATPRFRAVTGPPQAT